MMGEMQHEDLILAAMPDAKKIALAFAATKASGFFDRDELIAIAYSALVDAATRYDGSREFAKFAKCRVRGAILDALRGWSQMTGAKKKNTTTVIQIEAEDGTLVATPFVTFNGVRDVRPLGDAVAALPDRDARKIRRYAEAEGSRGDKSSDKIYLEFGMSNMLWQYHRRRILAKLRFELQQRGITKVSDCL
jgi:hypothetical protein